MVIFRQMKHIGDAESMDDGKRVQSIDRAVMMLKLFSETTRELKLTEIAERLDLHKSTTFGILSTLKYNGLISQNEDNQKYSLGTYLLELSNTLVNSMDIRAIAYMILNNLRNTLEETVHLGMIENFEVIYIDKQESTQSMRIFTTIGARNPAYCTGIGKAMMAYMDQEYLKTKLPDALERFTEKTIVDKAQLLAQFSEIRKNGYAMDDEERIEGLTCVAAPIFDHMGKVKYAISVSGPSVRMSDKKIQETIRLVKKSAQEISEKLGYNQK